MSSFKSYKVAHGISGLLYRISPTEVIKAAWNGRSHHIEHERKILERLGQHPRIIQSFSTQREGQLSLEYHPHDLRKLLNSGGEIHLWRWLRQITEAIVYLHSKDVIHRDLSPRNILITAQKDVVLCDFAGSSLDSTWLEECQGEIRFCRHTDDKPSAQDDIFALGCVFYEVLTRLPPYAKLEDHEVIALYKESTFPAIGDLPIAEIITSCWMGRYETAVEVLSDLEQKATPVRQLRGSYETALHFLLCLFLTGLGRIERWTAIALAYVFRLGKAQPKKE